MFVWHLVSARLLPCVFILHERSGPHSVSDCISHIFTLTLKKANHFFPFNTPGYDNVSAYQVWYHIMMIHYIKKIFCLNPYQVCLQKVQQFRRYCLHKHQLKLWAPQWPWLLPQQSNIFTGHFGFWRFIVKLSLVPKGLLAQKI